MSGKCIDPFVDGFRDEFSSNHRELIANRVAESAENSISSVMKPNATLETPFDDMRTLKMHKNIGKGAFGSVMLCHTSQSDDSYSVKACEDPWMKELIITQLLREELVRRNASQMLKYFSIIDYGVSLADYATTLYISKYIDGGTLVDLIEFYDTANKSLSRIVLTVLCCEITKIIDCLHEMRIIHLDIKTDNLMLRK